MSCITEILKITKNEPYLVKDKSDSEGVVIEGGGEYNGYEFIVTFTPMGHRCGYVALPADHKMNKREEHFNGYGDIKCHGGITFAHNTHKIKKLLNIKCTDRWIGFDCAHWDDAKDYPALRKHFGEDCGVFQMIKKIPNFDSHKTGTTKSYNFVVGECKKIIDQLAA